MSDADDKDVELSRLLRCWGPPPVSAGLDERVLAAYRRRTTPLWRRLLAAEVRVPLPLAAALLLILLVSTVLALRRPVPGEAAARPASGEAVQSAQRGEPALVTRTSLAGFRPVEEIGVSVVKEGRR
jgi:hypothetical protein